MTSRRRRGTDPDGKELSDEIADSVPHKGARVDDEAREELASVVERETSRRDLLRVGAIAGGGILAGLLVDRLAQPALGAPGDGIPGSTISNTDIDAKRIAGIRIASEFASSKHAGTSADPWPGSAIQAAMDDLPAGGGVVFVPGGTWNASSPLRITRSDIALGGTGSATRLVTNGSGFTANSSGMVEISGQLKGVFVERLSLDGRNTDTCRGILITGGAEVLVRDCAFINWLGTLSQRGRGLTVVHNPNTEAPPHKGVRVEGCYFWNNQIGIVMHRTLYTILNSYFEDNVWDGMYMEGTARGAIIGNLVTFSDRVGIFLIFNDRQTVVGNRVEDCGSGIQVYEARGMSIVGNHIERCASAGVDIRTNSAHCIVSGNVIAHCSSVPGIQLISNASECAVTDNVSRLNEDGIAALTSSNHRIQGNVCLENSHAGIYVQNSTRIRILANRAAQNPYGVLADGTSNYLMVKDNDLRGNTTGARSLVGANNTVADNWET